MPPSPDPTLHIVTSSYLNDREREGALLSCKGLRIQLLILSHFFFLSNFYHSPIAYRDIVFDNVEHAYQYAKATHFKDSDSSEKILCAKTPSLAKHIGSKVKNFKLKEWSVVSVVSVVSSEI